jgi:hypothetical protein
MKYYLTLKRSDGCGTTVWHETFVFSADLFTGLAPDALLGNGRKATRDCAHHARPLGSAAFKRRITYDA